MNSRQIYNLFSFAGMMLLSNQLVRTSPDYLEEKCLLFIGKMGKDEFIKYPEQCIVSMHINDFWSEYCSIWDVDKDNYRLMNVLNYLMGVNFHKESTFFDNFEIYFVSGDSISCEDLRSRVHPLLVEYLDENIVNSRYLKLKSLE